MNNYNLPDNYNHSASPENWGDEPEIDSFIVMLEDKPVYGSFNSYAKARLVAGMTAKANEGKPVCICAEYEDGKRFYCAELIQDGEETFFEYEKEPDYSEAD